jgi:hypothetical protein
MGEEEEGLCIDQTFCQAGSARGGAAAWEGAASSRGTGRALVGRGARPPWGRRSPTLAVWGGRGPVLWRRGSPCCWSLGIERRQGRRHEHMGRGPAMAERAQGGEAIGGGAMGKALSWRAAAFQGAEWRGAG